MYEKFSKVEKIIIVWWFKKKFFLSVCAYKHVCHHCVFLLTSLTEAIQYNTTQTIQYNTLITCVIVRSNPRRLFSFYASSNGSHYNVLIICVIAPSNPRRLFSFHVSSNAGHYQSTMTSHSDPRTWCHERPVRFLSKRQTSARTTPRTHAFITLRDDCHVWTNQNSPTGIDSHWVKRKFSKVFLHKLHLKCTQNV